MLSSACAADVQVYPGTNTIQTALNAAANGDRLLLHTGTYSQVVSVSGRSGITITSFGDGLVTVQGNGTSDVVFYIVNSSSITLSNLTIKNTFKSNYAKGIFIDGYGSNITISGNQITDVSYRTGTFSSADLPPSSTYNANPLVVAGSSTTTPLSNIVITGNNIYQCMTGWSEAVAIKGNVDGFLVQNNTVSQITNIAMDAYGLGNYPNAMQARNGQFLNNTITDAICNYTDNGGIYVDGGKDILIANNVVKNSVYGITIGCENQGNVSGGTTSGIRVVNNLVHNNRKSAIMIGTSGDDDGVQGNVVNCLVTGNTFLKNALGNQWASEIVLQNCSNIQFFNNIVFGTYQQMITQALGVSGNTFGYNIFFNPVGLPTISKETSPGSYTGVSFAQFKTDNGDATSNNADPLLVNASASAPDAHLSAGSPCINAGKPGFIPISGEKDLDGHARIAGSAVDKGVDEYGSTGNVAVTGISVSPATATMSAGATQQLTATIAPAGATNQNRTWTSSNTGVATVSASGLVTGVSAGTSVITVTSQQGSYTATANITVTAASLPSPWVTTNIGTVGASGSASYSAGNFTVGGSGADIYGTTDAFRFVYRSLNGDGEIRARVVSLPNTNAWAKAGVMIRENLSANSNHVLCALTPSNGAIFQRHLVTGDVTSQTQVTGITAPRWLRLVRSGSTFTAFQSADGNAWTQIASQSVSMATSIYVGLAVTSHNDGVVCSVPFDNVSVTSGTTPTVSIVVDGTLTDWSSVGNIASGSAQTSTSLKAYANSSTIYFAVSGSGMNATNYQLFMNSDNNAATGYQDGDYTSSGADYMIENGSLYRSAGTGWAWTSAAATIQVSKGASVTEIGVNRTAFTGLGAAIRVAYKDISSGFTTISRLPVSGTYALYTLGAARGVSVIDPAPGVGNLENAGELSVKIAPNPAKAGILRFQVTIPAYSDVRFIITDTYGRMIQRKNLGLRQAGKLIQEIDLASYQRGVYFLRVYYGGTSTTVKFITE